jgi:cytochrome c oxidase subunit III
MPGTTTTEEIQLVITDKGGGGAPSGNGGDGGGEGGGSFNTGAVPQRTYITGMIIALGGILMFFMALVSAYIVHKGNPNAHWVPFTLPRILTLNTLILIGSSFTLARSHKLFLAHDDEGFRHWWNVTTVLGVFFLVGQVIAWRQLVAAGIYLKTNPSSSFFYVFTAAHGLHLLGGVLALLSVALRKTQKLTRGTATEVVSLYWHFMDGLWVFLFLLFVMGR